MKKAPQAEQIWFRFTVNDHRHELLVWWAAFRRELCHIIHELDEQILRVHSDPKQVRSSFKLTGVRPVVTIKAHLEIWVLTGWWSERGGLSYLSSRYGVSSMCPVRKAYYGCELGAFHSDQFLARPQCRGLFSLGVRRHDSLAGLCLSHDGLSSYVGWAHRRPRN